MRRFKRNRGVPKGYSHNWLYKGRWKEYKVGKGKWKGRFKAAKSRGGSSRGGLKKGARIAWYIRGVQYATKVGGRRYLTDFKFTKTLIKKPKEGKR